jgi:hypothetical protein
MPDDRLGGRGRESATPGDRVPYTWVSDDSTGHRFDVKVVRPGMTPVPGVELNYGPTPRRPKHNVDKSGAPAVPSRVPESSGDATAAQAAPATSPQKPAKT